MSHITFLFFLFLTASFTSASSIVIETEDSITLPGDEEVSQGIDPVFFVSPSSVTIQQPSVALIEDHTWDGIKSGLRAAGFSMGPPGYPLDLERQVAYLKCWRRASTADQNGWTDDESSNDRGEGRRGGYDRYDRNVYTCDKFDIPSEPYTPTALYQAPERSVRGTVTEFPAILFGSSPTSERVVKAAVSRFNISLCHATIDSSSDIEYAKKRLSECVSRRSDEYGNSPHPVADVSITTTQLISGYESSRGSGSESISFKCPPLSLSEGQAPSSLEHGEPLFSLTTSTYTVDFNAIDKQTRHETVYSPGAVPISNLIGKPIVRIPLGGTVSTYRIHPLPGVDIKTICEAGVTVTKRDT